MLQQNLPRGLGGPTPIDHSLEISAQMYRPNAIDELRFLSLWLTLPQEWGSCGAG